MGGSHNGSTEFWLYMVQLIAAPISYWALCTVECMLYDLNLKKLKNDLLNFDQSGCKKQQIE